MRKQLLHDGGTLLQRNEISLDNSFIVVVKLEISSIVMNIALL